MTDTEQASSTETTQSVEAPAETAARPDGFPEDHWLADSNSPNWESFLPHYQEMASAAAERSSHLAQIPEGPDGYALDLPADFEMPEGADGAEFKIDPESGIAQGVKAWAHEHGVPQSAVTALLGLYAKDVVGSASAEVAAAREELGARADERLGAVDNWLKAQGLSSAEYDALANVATSAASIQAMEKIMARMQSRMSGAKTEGDASDIPTSLDEVRELKNSAEYRPGSDADRRVKAFYAKHYPGQIRANA